jgi:hypothetical protein
LVGSARIGGSFGFTFRSGNGPPVVAPKRTWAEKITDDQNAWLEARRLQLEGDFLGAADSYARDKRVERDRGHYARAALSAACQGRCLERLGLDGTAGFENAALLYARAAWVELRTKPRLALQLFERARECCEQSHSVRASRELTAVSEAIRVALEFADGYRHGASEARLAVGRDISSATDPSLASTRELVPNPSR